MRANFDNYVKVAHECSSYTPVNPNTAFTASVGDNVSCLNCKYLDQTGHCTKDLYDKIIEDNE